MNYCQLLRDKPSPFRNEKHHLLLDYTLLKYLKCPLSCFHVSFRFLKYICVKQSPNLNSRSGVEVNRPQGYSAEVVLATLLFEEVELLHGLESVHVEVELFVGGHAETLHVVLELDVEEEGLSHVVGVGLGDGFIGGTVDGSNDSGGVVLELTGEFGTEGSGVIVSLGLGEGNTERHVLVDLIEGLVDILEEVSLGIGLDLSGLLSGVLVGSNVGIGNGGSTLIGESLEELVHVRSVRVVSLDSLGGSEESGEYEKFHMDYYYNSTCLGFWGFGVLGFWGSAF